GSGVGIDRGVVKVVTRSDGIFHHQVFARDREVEHAKKLQRGLARTRKGSARRGRAAGRVADLAGRIGRRRQDFAAKTACVLAAGFELVVFGAPPPPARRLTAPARVPGERFGDVDEPSAVRETPACRLDRLLSTRYSVRAVRPAATGVSASGHPPGMPCRRRNTAFRRRHGSDLWLVISSERPVAGGRRPSCSISTWRSSVAGRPG
ncbi:hypothetical protein ACFV0L_40260, partial [Streptosporangium canum]